MSIFKLLIIYTQLHSVILWCLYSSFNQSTVQINEVDWSPDGQYFSVASDVATVYQFNTLTPIWSQNYSAGVNTAKFSKLGKYLAVGTNASEIIYIYNVPSFTLYVSLQAFQVTTAQQVYQVDFSPDDTKIVACGSNSYVSVVKFTNATNPYLSFINKTVQSGTGKAVWSCKYSDINDIIGLVCSSCTNVDQFLYSSNLTMLTQTSWTNATSFYDVDFQPNSSTILYSGMGTSANKTLLIMNASGVNSYSPTNYNNNIYAVSCAHDLSYIAIGTKKSFAIINTVSKNMDFFSNYTVAIWGVRASDDSNYVIVGTASGTIEIYKRICRICPIGQYQNQSQCTICSQSILGCSSCKNATFCYTCYLGYFLDASNGCTQCQVALQGCEFCYNSSVCQKCDSSYYLSGNTCFRCNQNIPYCQQCDNNGSCIKCGYMHYLINNICQRCSDILPNCIHCYQTYDTAANQQNLPNCLKCRQGYYASNEGKCITCQPNCIYCNNQICSQCAHQYQLNPATGNCMICGITHCLTCNHQGTQCIQCSPSTTNANINVCSPCSSPCVTCSSTTSTCTSCEVGYFLNGTNCLKCQGCLICDPLSGICLQCPIGQYFDSISNHCILCLSTTSHCAICSASACIVCERNFVLMGSICSPIIGIPNCMVYQKNQTSICEHCIIGYYLNTTNLSCLSCPSNCEMCNNESNCLSCILKYYYNSSNQNCQPCISPCVTCNSSFQCLSCGNEHYLNGIQCLSCRKSLSNCYKCLNEFTCINCQLGYHITNNNICAICTPPCATCSVSSTNCLSCIVGYDYSQNSCYSCPASCATCNSSLCTSCIAGYTLNQTSPNVYSCVNCSLLYNNCQYCNQTNCLFCNSYFMLNSSNVCQQCNISNCIECDNVGLCNMCNVGFYSDGLQCNSCSSVMFMCEKCANELTCGKCMIGYYVNAVNNCSKCMVGCVICDNPNICITCEVGFLMKSNVCKTCDQVTPGCSMCNQTVGCFLCSHGYYFELGSCVLCRSVMQGCANCNSNSSCLSCDGGYFMNSSSNKCELCSSQPGCQICNQINQICTVCSSGYFLNITNQCQLCSTVDNNCIYCNSSECLTCKTGYYISLGICQPCETVHQFCTICNSTNCFECLSGFYIPSLSSDCQQCNIVGCSICSSNGTVCLSCSNLYYMVGNVCKFCEDIDFGCLTCNDQNQCLICKSGYFLNANDGVCVLCPQGCSMCSSQVCITCQSNYFINVSNPSQSCSICSSFVTGCQLCLNQTHCLSCDLGYSMNSALLCQSCTVIPQCMICSDNLTCLFCQVGSYLSNGKCLLCSTANKGCYSCSTPQICLSCSGNFIINEGKCIPLTSTTSISVFVSNDSSTIKIFCEYISQTSLKITVYTANGKFYKTQQNWNNDVTLQLVSPPALSSNPNPLTINDVSWGSSNPLNSLSFYTDNPLGNINLGDQSVMPFMGSLTNRRLLITFQQLNINLNFNMKKAVINELMPSLDTNGNDLTLSYNLNNPQFYKSILQQQTQHYWLFGMMVTVIFIVLYLIKACWTVPSTKDAGQIIPHVLLMKVPAMVIYPSFAGYINYCYGFSLIDFPMANSYFSEKFTQQSDQSPPSYKMFYNNLNIGSTYIVPLLVFIFIIIPITSIILFHKYSKKCLNKKKVGNFIKNQQTINDKNQSYIDYIFNIILNSQSLVYHIFITGLAFHSTINIIGIVLNPNNVISISGFFYIFGVLIFAIVLIDAVRSFYSANQQFNKLRVVIKAIFMAFMYMSPIPLFAGMVVIDISMMMYEYRVKLKQWVIPQLWLVSQFSCLIGYASLIFLSNMKLGIIIASVCVLVVILSDSYLHYYQYLEVQKVMILKKVDLSITQQSFSIQNYQPDKNELYNKKRNELFFEDKQLLNKQNLQYKNNKNNLYYQLQQNNLSDLQKFHSQSQQNVLKQTEQYANNNL